MQKSTDYSHHIQMLYCDLVLEIFLTVPQPRGLDSTPFRHNPNIRLLDWCWQGLTAESCSWGWAIASHLLGAAADDGRMLKGGCTAYARHKAMAGQ